MLTYDNNEVDIQGPTNQGALHTCSSSLLNCIVYADNTNIYFAQEMTRLNSAKT